MAIFVIGGTGFTKLGFFGGAMWKPRWISSLVLTALPVDGDKATPQMKERILREKDIVSRKMN